MVCGYTGFINAKTLYCAWSFSGAMSNSNYISWANGGKLTAKKACRLQAYCGKNNATGAYNEYTLSTGQLVTLPYNAVALVIVYDA